MKYCLHCGKSVPQVGKMPVQWYLDCKKIPKAERTVRYSAATGKPIEGLRSAWR